VTTSARNGEIRVPEMTELRPSPTTFGRAEKIRPSTMFTTSMMM
jgi:hypothetical protein